MLHTREKCVGSVKLGDPFSKNQRSSHSSEIIQEKTPVDTVTVHMPPVAAQMSLHINGFLAHRNMATVGQLAARDIPSAEHRTDTGKPYECSEYGSTLGDQLCHILYHKKHTGVHSDAIKVEDP